jgi:arsenate reductase-like glutaredoxin family protein
LNQLARGAGGVRSIFSWRSPSARSLAHDEATVTDEQLLELMAAEPRLIRRPLVAAGEQVIVGADPKMLETALAP